MIPGNLTAIALAAKAATATYALTIAANTANYNIYNAARAAGWSGTTPINVVLTNNATLYSTSTSVPQRYFYRQQW